MLIHFLFFRLSESLWVIFSHIMFMVLDHDRENPLHHAPIGKSPQVREILELNVYPMLRVNPSTFWILGLVKEHGLCKFPPILSSGILLTLTQ